MIRARIYMLSVVSQLQPCCDVLLFEGEGPAVLPVVAVAYSAESDGNEQEVFVYFVMLI